MSPPVVLFVDHATALGGAQHSLLLLLERLDRARWAPRLACQGGVQADRAAALDVAVERCRLPRLRRRVRAGSDWPAGAAALAGLARGCGAAVVVANTVRAALYAAPAARLAGRPLVWYARDFWLTEAQPRHRWPDRAGRWLLGAASAQVVAVSAAVAAGLPAAARVTVVRNGIDLDRFTPGVDGAPFRRRHGIPPDAPVVGMLGRLRPWKGQERFLDAGRAVLRAVPEARLVVAGGDPFGIDDGYAGHLRRLAAAPGLAGRVTFTGHLDDVRGALAALDVAVHPGDPEPFGRATVEAMALAKPVVGFGHGALPEIVADGQTGLLVPPDRQEALAAAVVGLLGDPARRRAFGVAGRARAEARFAAGRMAAGFQSVLDRVRGTTQGG